MKTHEKRKRIVWAVDPFCKDCSLVKRAARSVAKLAADWNAVVEPAYVLGGFPPNVRLLPTLIKSVQQDAQEELKDLIRGIKVSNLLPIHIIGSSTSQLREQVDRLVAYARQSGADLITVSTRAKKGPARWIMGSFAETLVLRSDVPLFVINPHEAISSSISHILFPTDFSDESKGAFREAVRFAKDIGARITVFHKLKYDLTPAVEAAFGAYPVYKQVFEQEVNDRRNQADSWVRVAREAGVSANSFIDYRMEGSMAATILRKSKSRGGIIAMAAHSGPLASALIGSVTRQVVRSANCPVWVIHTERKKAETPPFTVAESDVLADLQRIPGTKKAA